MAQTTGQEERLRDLDRSRRHAARRSAAALASASECASSVMQRTSSSESLLALLPDASVTSESEKPGRVRHVWSVCTPAVRCSRRSAQTCPALRTEDLKCALQKMQRRRTRFGRPQRPQRYGRRGLCKRRSGLAIASSAALSRSSKASAAVEGAMLDAAIGSIDDYSFAKATVEMRSLSCAD